MVQKDCATVNVKKQDGTGGEEPKESEGFLSSLSTTQKVAGGVGLAGLGLLMTREEDEPIIRRPSYNKNNTRKR